MDSIKLEFNTPKLKKLRTIYIVEDNAMERNMLVDFLSLGVLNSNFIESSCLCIFN